MENVRQMRGQRTTMEQLEAYLRFLEENPQFKAGKNTPENMVYLDEKWKELATKLNGLKGPIKIAKDWKTSLTHWKYQLKSRARKIREEILITGGGETTTASLSTFEERALHLFGMVSVRGDDAIPVIGFENSNQTSVANSVVESGVSVTHSPMESTVAIPMPGTSSHEPPQTAASTSRKRQYSNTFSSAISDCVDKIGKLAENRAKEEALMAERRLAIDQQNADAMTRMAQALYILAKQFENKK